jgi:lipoprotein-anchoring transpeptidase ErfK/SrfK
MVAVTLALGMVGGPMLVSAVSSMTAAHQVPETSLAPAPNAGSAPRVAVPQPVDAAQLALLPQSTTDTTVTAAPSDPAPEAYPNGLLANVSAAMPVYVAPGGVAIASLPTKEMASQTALPVIATEPGWVQVLLPSRPNGSTGWLFLSSSVTLTRSPYLIEVDRTAFRLTLLHDGLPAGQWTVGVGRTDAITPAGRTMVLSKIADTNPSYSPTFLATGAHSDIYQRYDGGPGSVGIHGWPSASVFGQAASAGCIRVPAAALETLQATVPVGTPVVIR